MIIPVGIDSKSGGDVVFSAQSNNLPSSCKVILEDKLNVYATGNTEIRVVGEVSNKAVATLYDVHGKVVTIQKLGEGTLNVIPLANIKSGVYILSVKDQWKEIRNYKIGI